MRQEDNLQCNLSVKVYQYGLHIITESVDFLEVRNISTIEYLELSIVFLPCSLRSFKTLGLEQHGANRK